jgi:hypothetical protein
MSSNHTDSTEIFSHMNNTTIAKIIIYGFHLLHQIHIKKLLVYIIRCEVSKSVRIQLWRCLTILRFCLFRRNSTT